MEVEIWKDIQGYEGYYQISNQGRVKSFHNKNPKILKLSVTKFGYHRVELNLKGHAKKHSVHRLVAMTFIPNPHKYKVINHIDGNKLNNIPENLEWCTYQENTKHAVDTGLLVKPKGELNGSSKLTEKQVIEIRKLYETGNYKQVELAEMYGLHKQYVNLIIHRRRWNHV